MKNTKSGTDTDIYERIWNIGLPIYMLDVVALCICGLMGFTTIGRILFTISALVCCLIIVVLIVMTLWDTDYSIIRVLVFVL